MAVSANRLELLQIADAVAREKSIDRMVVIEAMQDAIEKAARSRYGAETEVRAVMDHLFAGRTEDVAGLDQRIQRFPGLEGMRIFRRAFDRLGIA